MSSSIVCNCYRGLSYCICDGKDCGNMDGENISKPDKLKEIRDSVINKPNLKRHLGETNSMLMTLLCGDTFSDPIGVRIVKAIDEIQSETYQLGWEDGGKDERERVIDKVKNIARQCFPYAGLSDEHGFHLEKFEKELLKL